jgi:hypothetical protein
VSAILMVRAPEWTWKRGTREGPLMATKTGRTGFPLAAAGVGIIGVAIVFGLTTSTGDVDWIGIITAVAGFVMVFTGLYQAFRGGGRHPA